MLLIVLQNPVNSDAQADAKQLTAALARVVLALRPKARALLTRWLASLPPSVLGGRVVRPLQRHLTAYVEVRCSRDKTTLLAWPASTLLPHRQRWLESVATTMRK